MVEIDRTLGLETSNLYATEGRVQITITLLNHLVQQNKGWFGGQNKRFYFNQKVLRNDPDETLRMSDDVTVTT